MKKAPATEVNKRPSQGNSNTSNGRLSPRQRRALVALLQSPLTSREVGNITGALNPAETIAQLRRMGLTVAVDWQQGKDRDGKAVRYGIYRLADASKDVATALLRC